jgi:Fe-S-cluster-containing dehydrogenase component/CRP-like cAMP-binding protein
VTVEPAWPAVAWTTPVLRGLDDAARAALARGGRITLHRAGATIYREGDAGDSFFVVASGTVELRGVRRGDAEPTLVRTVRTGDSFGEEVFLPGLTRRLTATAAGPVTVVELPVAVFQRVTQRAGGGAAQREQRYLERAAAGDLLACSAFARELDPGDLELLLDAAQLERMARGTRIYEPGAIGDRFYFVIDGLVQLQREALDEIAVTAYLARGDFFGDQEALAGGPRRVAAVAAGDTWCAAVPREVLRTLSDRNPGLLPRLRRVAQAQEAAQGDVIGAAAARSTQHVFRDLYRMQMARSLLVIDQDACVRCGHCAWSCEQVHGTSRLIRRGDKVVTQLAGSGAATLLLPNTCQHCRHAACMIDCPTGAIGRDPEGEVFIRPSLCTGCGNCAKACPWENIQMAPRPPAPGAPGRSGDPGKLVLLGHSRSPDIAVKCDLCHGYEAPACVEACPTGAVLRLDPARDVTEVARVLCAPAVVTGGPPPRDLTARIGRSIGTSSAAPVAAPVAAAIAIALTAGGWALHRAFAWSPARGMGLAAGILAALLVVALGAYVVPKRRVRARMRRRDPAARLVPAEARPAPRSRTRRHFMLHLGLGGLVPGLVLAHAGAHLRSGPGDALAGALAITVLFGALAAIMYRLVPRALTRLERRGTLPEDLAGERDALEARLYQAVTGKSDRVKALADRILLPYARAWLGPVRLVGSGRRLAGERDRLRRQIDVVLAGRTPDGAGELIEIAVELRALPARRLLGRMLSIWPPLHAIAGAMTAALLLVHIVTVVLK